MNLLQLNDGTEIAVMSCGAAQGILWIRLADPLGVYDAATLFKDPEKLSRLTFLYGGDMETVHEGYTKLIRVNIDDYEGMTEVTLKRPLN